MISVKDNQGTIREDITPSFAILKPSDQHTDHDKNGGHCETRVCSVINNLKMIENTSQWTGLKSIVQLESTRIIGSKTERKLRYYISSS